MIPLLEREHRPKKTLESIELKVQLREALTRNTSSLTPEQKQMIMTQILRMDPRDRKEDEIKTLVTLTQNLEFFEKINKKKVNQETCLSEKICHRMKYERYSKGQTVIEFGAKADKFFIILSGQVSIFLAKTPEAIASEAPQMKFGRITKFLPEEETTAANIQESFDQLNSPSPQVFPQSPNIRRESIRMQNSPIIRRQSVRPSSMLQSLSNPGSPQLLLQSPSREEKGSPQLLEDKTIEKSRFSNFYHPPKERTPSIGLKHMHTTSELNTLSQQPQSTTTTATGEQKLSPFHALTPQAKPSIHRGQSMGRSIYQLKLEILNNKSPSVSQPTQETDSSPQLLNQNQNPRKGSSSNSTDGDAHTSKNNQQTTHHLLKLEPAQFAISQWNKRPSKIGSTIEEQIPLAESPQIKEEDTSRRLSSEDSSSNESDSQSGNSSPLRFVPTNSMFLMKPPMHSLRKQSEASVKTIDQSQDKFTYSFIDEKTSPLSQMSSSHHRKSILGNFNLINAYRNSQIFGADLQIQNIERPERFFTEDGIFMFQYRDRIFPGETFGELGLIEGKPRSALIICSADSEFAIMEKEDYSELLAQRDRKNILMKFNFLKDHLLPDLTNDAIKKVFYSFQKRKTKKNEVLFSQGDLAKGIFIIKKGEVILSQKQSDSPSNQETKEHAHSDDPHSSTTQKSLTTTRTSLLFKPKRLSTQTIAILGTGEYFGEEDLLRKENNGKRQFTATCSSISGSVYYIEGNIFMRLLKQKPGLLLTIMNRMKQKQTWRNEFQGRTHDNAIKQIVCESSSLTSTAAAEQAFLESNPFQKWEKRLSVRAELPIEKKTINANPSQKRYNSVCRTSSISSTSTASSLIKTHTPTSKSTSTNISQIQSPIRSQALQSFSQAIAQNKQQRNLGKIQEGNNKYKDSHDQQFKWIDDLFDQNNQPITHKGIHNKKQFTLTMFSQLKTNQLSALLDHSKHQSPDKITNKINLLYIFLNPNISLIKSPSLGSMSIIKSEGNLESRKSQFLMKQKEHLHIQSNSNSNFHTARATVATPLQSKTTHIPFRNNSAQLPSDLSHIIHPITSTAQSSHRQLHKSSKTDFLNKSLTHLHSSQSHKQLEYIHTINKQSDSSLPPSLLAPLIPLSDIDRQHSPPQQQIRMKLINFAKQQAPQSAFSLRSYLDKQSVLKQSHEPYSTQQLPSTQQQPATQSEQLNQNLNSPLISQKSFLQKSFLSPNQSHQQHSQMLSPSRSQQTLSNLTNQANKNTLISNCIRRIKHKTDSIDSILREFDTHAEQPQAPQPPVQQQHHHLPLPISPPLPPVSNHHQQQLDLASFSSHSPVMKRYLTTKKLNSNKSEQVLNEIQRNSSERILQRISYPIQTSLEQSNHTTNNIPSGALTSPLKVASNATTETQHFSRFFQSSTSQSKSIAIRKALTSHLKPITKVLSSKLSITPSAMMVSPQSNSNSIIQLSNPSIASNKNDSPNNFNVTSMNVQKSPSNSPEQTSCSTIQSKQTLDLETIQEFRN